MKVLIIASVLSLISLALMTWSVLSPRPIPVVAAMSVGQGLGSLALLLFGYSVWMDLRRARVLGPAAPDEAPKAPGEDAG